jgi:hypothetical protein
MKKVVELAPTVRVHKTNLARLEVAQKAQFEKQKEEMMGAHRTVISAAGGPPR